LLPLKLKVMVTFLNERLSNFVNCLEVEWYWLLIQSHIYISSHNIYFSGRPTERPGGRRRTFVRGHSPFGLRHWWSWSRISAQTFNFVGTKFETSRHHKYECFRNSQDLFNSKRSRGSKSFARSHLSGCTSF